MEKRVVFRSAWLPYALVAPQIAITIVFFFWPAAQAVWYSFQLQDAFGLQHPVRLASRISSRCSAIRNYLASFKITAIFSVLGRGARHRASRCCSPTMADRVVRGALAYKTLLIWPYAVAPAVAGVLWAFLFAPSIGIVTFVLKAHGRRLELDPQGRPGDAAGGDRVGVEADHATTSCSSSPACSRSRSR